MNFGQYRTAAASIFGLVSIETSYQPHKPEVLFQGYLLLHRASGVVCFHFASEFSIFLMQHGAWADFKIGSQESSSYRLSGNALWHLLYINSLPGVLV